MHSRILVPVDLDNAERLTKALDLAARMAKEAEATVVYVSVVDVVPTTSPLSESAHEADRLAGFASTQARAHGIAVDHHIALRGDLHLTVGADIVQAAEVTGCDLIVMASHVPGIKEHFLSSNAGYVASHAPISVFVVR